MESDCYETPTSANGVTERRATAATLGTAAAGSDLGVRSTTSPFQPYAEASSPLLESAFATLQDVTHRLSDLCVF